MSLIMDSAKDIMKRIDLVIEAKDEDEWNKEAEKLLAYLEGVLAAEKNMTNKVFLGSLILIFHSRMAVKKEIKETNDKIDKFHSELNSVLERVGKLEKRFDDLDKGK